MAIESAFQKINATTQTTNAAGPFPCEVVTISATEYKIPYGISVDTNGTAIDFATQTTLAAINAKVPALGQALAAASVPVVLTAAQLSTLTPPAAITGYATESTLGTLSAKFASGTVIGDVNLGATDNAVLDAIAASVAGATPAGSNTIGAVNLAQYTPASGRLPVDGSGVTQPVSGTVSVTGVATAANQATGNTSLSTIAGAVSGTEMQVDVLTMPTVTVVNGGTFATQIDGAALTSLQLLDDSVATVGSAITTKGMTAIGTDGTNALALKVDSNGELQVDVLSLPALAAGTNNIGDVDVLSLPALPTGTNSIGQVTANAGTNLNTSALALESGGNLAAIATSAALIDDAVYTRDSAQASKVIAIGLWDVNGDPDNVKAAICDGSGRQYVNIQNSNGDWDINNGAVGNTLRVTIANDSTGVLASVGTVTTLTGGGVAHDSVDSGNPHKIGMKAIAHGTNPTAVAAADRSDVYCNRAGIPFVIGGHPNVITVSARVLDSDGAQTNVSLVTVSSGTKIVVTRISVKADGSNSGPVNCTVGFAAATLATPNTTSGDGILLDHQGIAAGGGSVEGNGSGILGVGGDGEDLRYTCEDPAGGALTISVSYYTIES